MEVPKKTPEQMMAEEIGSLIGEQIDQETVKEETVSSIEELSGERVFGAERTRTRLLIYTTNVTIFDSESELCQRIIDLATLFAEIHVIAINVTSRGGIQQNMSPAPNVWVYATNSKSNWASYKDGMKVTEAQMIFANGFRADIILALDPFMAGAVARKMAKKYERSLQVHLTTNYFDKTYQKQQKNWRIKSWAMNKLFAEKPSVRVANKIIYRQLLVEYPELEAQTDVIPQYLDLDEIRSYQPKGEVKERYPKHSVIVLFVGPLTAQSGVEAALEASQHVLQHPMAAFMALGTGPYKEQLEKKAEIMELTNQVIIAPPGLSLLEALAGATMFVYAGGPDADERVVVKAAAAGVPVVSANTETLNQLFVNQESAWLCEPGNTECLAAGLNRLLNDNAMRRRFTRLAKEDVFDRIETNIEQYKESVKTSIESVLYVYDDEVMDEMLEGEEGKTS